MSGFKDFRDLSSNTKRLSIYSTQDTSSNFQRHHQLCKQKHIEDQWNKLKESHLTELPVLQGPTRPHLVKANSRIEELALPANFQIKNLITGETIDYSDIQKLKKREEEHKYIKLASYKSKLSEESFERKIEMSSFELLNLIVNSKSQTSIKEYLNAQIQHAFDLDTLFDGGRSFLVFAVLRGDRNIVEALLEVKPDLVFKLDSLGQSALHYTVLAKNLSLISVLIRNKANLNSKDCNGRTPLHLAGVLQQKDIYLILKYEGADGKLHDNYGLRPADYFRDPVIAEELLSLEMDSRKYSSKSNSLRSSERSSRNSSKERDTKLEPRREAYNMRCKYLRRVGVIKPHEKKKRFEEEAIFKSEYEGILKERYEMDEDEELESHFSISKLTRKRSKSFAGAVEFESKGLAIAHAQKGGSSNLIQLGGPGTNSSRLIPQIYASFKPREAEFLSLDDLVFHGLLGKGSYGEIFCVSTREGDHYKKFALKRMSKRKVLAKSSHLKFLLTEKKILMNFTHPFIVKLKATFQDDKRLYMMMDFCEKKDLSNFIGGLSEHQVKMIACELILAIKTLHQHGVIHRDIKPDNVLVDGEGHVKLADFGLSKYGVKSSALNTTFCGSVAYLPPEIVSKLGHDKSIDWYLLGELMYELIVGMPPFFDGTTDNLYDNILTKPLEFPSNIEVTVGFKNLISKLVAKSPKDRLGSQKGALEVMEHSYFKGIDWEKVYQRGYKVIDPAKADSYLLEDVHSMNFEHKETACKKNKPVNLPTWNYSRLD